MASLQQVRTILTAAAVGIGGVAVPACDRANSQNGKGNQVVGNSDDRPAVGAAPPPAKGVGAPPNKDNTVAVATGGAAAPPVPKVDVMPPAPPTMVTTPPAPKKDKDTVTVYSADARVDIAALPDVFTVKAGVTLDVLIPRTVIQMKVELWEKGKNRLSSISAAPMAIEDSVGSGTIVRVDSGVKLYGGGNDFTFKIEKPSPTNGNIFKAMRGSATALTGVPPAVIPPVDPKGPAVAAAEYLDSATAGIIKAADLKPGVVEKRSVAPGGKLVVDGVAADLAVKVTLPIVYTTGVKARAFDLGGPSPAPFMNFGRFGVTDTGRIDRGDRKGPKVTVTTAVGNKDPYQVHVSKNAAGEVVVDVLPQAAKELVVKGLTSVKDGSVVNLPLPAKKGGTDVLEMNFEGTGKVTLSPPKGAPRVQYVFFEEVGPAHNKPTFLQPKGVIVRDFDILTASVKVDGTVATVTIEGRGGAMPASTPVRVAVTDDNGTLRVEVFPQGLGAVKPK